MSRRALLIATRNQGKVREVSAILTGLPADLVTLAAFPEVPEAEETGVTFEENAEQKALYYARKTGLWSLADDSGLEVDAIGGEPGVRSARFAGRQGDDAANNAKLVAAISGVRAGHRTARFRCVMVLTDATTVLARGTGVLEGSIVDDPRGANGFGYDPHFYVASLGMTAAEMPAELKNAISHRAQALSAIRPEIERLLAVDGDAGSHRCSVTPCG